MSVLPSIKMENGRAVTGAEFPAPQGWINDYENMGGDMTWGPGAIIYEVLASSGLDSSDLKPLYGMDPMMGAAMNLFEAGSPSSFYLYNAIDSSLLKITEPNDLATIVDHLNDEDKGLGSLEIEPVV